MRLDTRGSFQRTINAGYYGLGNASRAAPPPGQARPADTTSTRSRRGACAASSACTPARPSTSRWARTSASRRRTPTTARASRRTSSRASRTRARARAADRAPRRPRRRRHRRHPRQRVRHAAAASSTSSAWRGTVGRGGGRVVRRGLGRARSLRAARRAVFIFAQPLRRELPVRPRALLRPGAGGRLRAAVPARRRAGRARRAQRALRRAHQDDLQHRDPRDARSRASRILGQRLRVGTNAFFDAGRVWSDYALISRRTATRSASSTASAGACSSSGARRPSSASRRLLAGRRSREPGLPARDLRVGRRDVLMSR